MESLYLEESHETFKPLNRHIRETFLHLSDQQVRKIESFLCKCMLNRKVKVFTPIPINFNTTCIIHNKIIKAHNSKFKPTKLSVDWRYEDSGI